MRQILNSITIISDYLIQMKREINPSTKYERLNIDVLTRLGDLTTVTRDDILVFLNSLKKPESIDPLHK